MSAREQTLKHIETVIEKITLFHKELNIRSKNHDISKLEEPEVSTFEIFTEKLKDSTYGSEEYKQFLKDMKPALDHHYANNRHHPEHFIDGINNMTLVDVIEMFCDWLAATERHEDGNIYKSIDINEKRFKMSSQLAEIFRNTAKEVYKK